MPVILHPNADFDQVMVRHPRGFEVILVRVGEEVRGFRNACPHLGVGLDWGDGRCLDADQPGVLRCAMHGARFDADTGACFAGPCAGRGLAVLPVRIEAGRVVCA